MKTEIRDDGTGRQWGYLLLTKKELAKLEEQYSPKDWQQMVAMSFNRWNVAMVPHGYEIAALDDRVFICVEHHDEDVIAVTFKQLENKLNV